jgi:predicted acylesterase/phospholipase RssA
MGSAFGPDDLYLKPPVEHIGLMRFDRNAEAIEAGYRHAMESLPAWLESAAPRSG